jgi:ABC-type antimicrobial peptide transport system permease subunit
MTVRDRLWISMRHMKSGIVGVVLVILATAIGIALAASTSAFIRAYREQTMRLLNHPVYREVLVEIPSFGETELNAPVVEIQLEKWETNYLSMDDMKAAVESAPAVEYAYVLKRDEVTTTEALMRMTKERAEKMNAVGKALEDDNTLVGLPVESFEGVRTSADFFSAYGLSAADGFLFTQDDLEAGNQVIVLGNGLAKTLFPDGGAVGSRVSLDFLTVTVVGVLGPTSLSDPIDLTPYDDMAFSPREALEKAWNKIMPVTSIRFTARDSADSRAAVNQLTTYFANAHPDIHVMITDSVAALRSERQTLSRVIVVLVFLSGVGLFVAAINLLNLMLIRIIKHTRGIGIMKALGSTRIDVFRQFMNESVLMCLIGFVIGVIVSPQVFALLQTTVVSGQGFTSETFVLDLFIGAAVGFLISVGFGLYPAILAKNTDTSLAIRAE